MTDISRKMTKAGVAVLLEFEWGQEKLSETVGRVYAAMEGARQRESETAKEPEHQYAEC